jgi:ferric-dicitrate binding protein FerR (iron transport regulator)
MAATNDPNSDSDSDSELPPASVTPPAQLAPVAVAPKKNWTRYLTPALALVAALILGGVAGVLIGQSTVSSTNASSVRGGFGGTGTGAGGTGTGAGGAGGAAGGIGTGAGARGGFTAGTITGVDGSTITVKLADGSTVKVNTSTSTKVTKTSTTSVNDLATGDTVTVVGAKDASGAVTATRISEGQLGLGGGFGGRAPGTGSTAAPSN